MEKKCNVYIIRYCYLNDKDVTSFNALRKLHNEKLNDLYSSPNIVRVIKSRMRWVGRVARMGRGKLYKWFWWGNLRERDHFEDPGIDGKIILRWIFRNWDVRA
jgi:hypothetical protein